MYMANSYPGDLFSKHLRTISLQWRHNGRDEFQITSLTIVYSTVYSGADQRKHQSSASLAFVRGIHRWPLNSPLKWQVTGKLLPFDDVIISFMVGIWYCTPVICCSWCQHNFFKIDILWCTIQHTWKQRFLHKAICRCGIQLAIRYYL